MNINNGPNPQPKRPLKFVHIRKPIHQYDFQNNNQTKPITRIHWATTISASPYHNLAPHPHFVRHKPIHDLPTTNLKTKQKSQHHTPSPLPLPKPKTERQNRNQTTFNSHPSFDLYKLTHDNLPSKIHLTQTPSPC